MLWTEKLLAMSPYSGETTSQSQRLALSCQVIPCVVILKTACQSSRPSKTSSCWRGMSRPHLRTHRHNDGDRSKNDIQLFTDGSGLHVVAQNGTSLNGVLNGSLVFGTFDQVVVDLQAGNDTLSVGNFAGGDITVQMGTGNDFAAFSAVTAGSLIADGGTGNDFISLDDDNG